MSGLQSWARQELQGRGVQNLSSAIVAAESLIEFKRGDSKQKGQKGNNGKGGGGGDKEAKGKSDYKKPSTEKERKKVRRARSVQAH